MYIWDAKDQQRLPRPYCFTDLPDGFLDLYRTKREKSIEFLNKQYALFGNIENGEADQILKLANILRKRTGNDVARLPAFIPLDACKKKMENKNQPYSSTELQNLKEFETSKVIATLFLLAADASVISDRKAQEHYRRILKKVELGKLRKYYDSHFLNRSDEGISMECYGYLGLTLGLVALEGDVQSLSTFLKVNDFIMSEKESLANALEIFLACTSLKLEMCIIEKIAGKLKVVK
jgi:hypothetical protein